jgi:exosome complex RNA-binding protein Rrp42 (RNase PH superfamily)
LTATFVNDKVCAIQKRGEKGLTMEETMKALQMARQKARELLKIVKGVVGSE